MTLYGATAQPHDSSKTGNPQPGMTFAQAVRSPWFYVFYLSVALLIGILAIFQSIPVHLQLMGRGDVIAAVMTTIALTMMAWKIILGWLVDAIGLRPAMTLTLGIYAVTCFVTPLVNGTFLLLLRGVGIAAGTANHMVSPPLAGAVAFGQREFPVIWGVMATAMQLGLALGTPVWGAIKDATGSFDLAWRAVPVLLVVSLAGLFVATARNRAAYTNPAGH